MKPERKKPVPTDPRIAYIAGLLAKLPPGERLVMIPVDNEVLVIMRAKPWSVEGEQLVELEVPK